LCPAVLDSLLAAFGPTCVVFGLDFPLDIWTWAVRLDPARTLLRQFVVGANEPSLGELDIACRRLEGHHSQSVLPGRVRAILRGRAEEMPASGKLQPWHCGTCQCQNKGNQEFCGGCGSHWQKVTYWSSSASQAAPWRPPQGVWQSPASPRRPRSPRKRAGKGQQGLEAPVAKGAPPPPPTSSAKSTGIACTAFHAYLLDSAGADHCPRYGCEPRSSDAAEAGTGVGAASGIAARRRARNFGCPGPDGGAGPYEEPPPHRLGSGHSSSGAPADSARTGGFPGHLEHVHHRPHHACREASRGAGQGPGRHGRAGGDVGGQAAGGNGEPCQACQQRHHTRAEDSHGCGCFGCGGACRGQGGRGYCHRARTARSETAAATVGVSTRGCIEASSGESRQGPRGAEQPAGTRGIPYTPTRRTGWVVWTSYCGNIVFLAGQLCGNAASAYQATTCSSPWQGLRIDGYQSDRSLGRFSVRETFPTDTRCSYSTVWMDPSFVLPARAQMQALLLQHEVRYDVQFSTSLVWDPRLESSREEAICVMPRALAESTVGPVFQSSRLPDVSDETGRPVRVGQDRVGHGHGRPAESWQAETCACTVVFPPFSSAERPLSHSKVHFRDGAQDEVATFRPGDRLPPYSQSQRVQHRVASTAPVLRLTTCQACGSSGPVAGCRQLSLSQHVPPMGVCTAFSGESKDGSMSNLAHLSTRPSDSAEVLAKPHDRENQCLGTPCRAPLAPPAGIPGKAARGPLLRRPGSIALLRADSIMVSPVDKRAAPIFEGPLSRFAWGGQSGSDEATVFTVFDHVRHVLVEKCAPGASLHDVVALALSDAPFQVGAVQVLSDVLPGLPALQIVLSELRRPVDELPIPWDFRQIGEPIKTVRHRALQDSTDALLDAQQLLHSPRDLRNEVAAGVVVVQDAIGALRPALPRALEEVQFFRVRLPVADGGALATDLELTTTTTSLFDEELLTRPVRRPRYLEGAEVIPRRILVAPAAHLPASSLGLFPHFRREGASAAPYHLLLRGFHPLRRMGQSRWTLMDFCDHAAMDINGSVRCVQVLATNIPGLLQPQIVVTAEADDVTAVLLPIDMRAGPGGEVVPVMLRPGSRFEDIVAAIDAELPGSRDFFDGLGGSQHCHFVDSQGLLVEALPADPRCLQWLELRPVAPPFLDRSVTTVTTTGAFELCVDTCWHDAEVTLTEPHRLPAPDLPDDRDPPTLLRLEPDRGARPKQCSSDWHLQPTTFRAFRDDRVSLKSWGAAEPETRHLFTVFDTVRHCTVITADGAISVVDFARRAAATAPQHVRSIQFLTAPVAGYPLPQVVLTYDNDGLNALAVPWDGRNAGLPIRTVAHQPGEGLLPAAQAYQRVQPMAGRFEVMVQSGFFVILDVAGVIDSALPLDLTEVQFLRIETRHGAGGVFPTFEMDALDGGAAGLFQGYGIPGLASVSSTTTTTQPTTFRLRLLYRGFEAWRDVLRPCVQLDLYVEAMLHELAAAGCIPSGPISITLAKAHPPPADFLQEVLFLVIPYNDFPAVHAVFDSRMQGGHIAADAVPEGVSVDQAVSSEWRRMGFSPWSMARLSSWLIVLSAMETTCR
ncbi:unnamed protein product, partial [Symbiodinium necroappetens]